MLVQKNRSLLSYSYSIKWYSYSKKAIGISRVEYEYDYEYRDAESAILEDALGTLSRVANEW